MTPYEAEPISAAEAIRRGRQQPEGVLIQTTHWHSQGQRAMLGVVAVMVLLFATTVIDDPTVRSASIALGVAGLPTALVVAVGLFMRGRAGILATPEGLFARGTFSRPIPLDPSVPLRQAPARGFLARQPSLIEYRGFLMARSQWQFVPAFRVRAAYTAGVGTRGPGLFVNPGRLVMGREGSRLMVRPTRPWYRVPARPTTYDDVVWNPEDDGRSVLSALGFAVEGAAATPAVVSPASVAPTLAVPGPGADSAPAATPAVDPAPSAADAKFDISVLGAAGPVRVGSNRVAPALAVVFAALLGFSMLGTTRVLSFERSPLLVLLGFFAFVTFAVAVLAYVASRTVEISPLGLSVRNGLRIRHEFAWSEVLGISIGRDDRKAPLRLDTTSGPVHLKALVYSQTQPRGWSQVIEWACSPQGLGRRQVTSAKHATVVLEQLFRSRGWQQDDAAASVLAEAEPRTGAADRLDRWNRDAA